MDPPVPTEPPPPPPPPPPPSPSDSPDDDASVDDFQVISVGHGDAGGDSGDAPPVAAAAVEPPPPQSPASPPPPQSPASPPPPHLPTLCSSPTTTTTNEPATQLTQAHFRSLENWILSAAQFEQASGKSLCDIIRANTKFRPTTNVERLLNLCQVDPFGTFRTPAPTTALSEDHYFDRLVKKYVEGISPS